MFEQNKPYQSGSAYEAGATTVDMGLRGHMLRVYNAVAAGLAVSGLTAAAVYYIVPLRMIFMNPIVSLVIGIGLLAFLWFGMNMQKAMQQSVASLQAKYYIFCTAIGTTLAYIFAAYGAGSIARVFFITAAMFGGVSLIGYTTKRDLSGFGSFLMMGLIGIIIASLVNIFLGSTGLQFIISILSVLIFTGLIAYESQAAKRMYSASNGDETNHK